MTQSVAKIISHVFSPFVVWPAFVAVLLVQTGLSVTQQQSLLGPVLVGEFILPIVWVVVLKRTGLVTDWEVTKVKERRWFFFGVLVCHALSFFFLYQWGTVLAWSLRGLGLSLEILGTGITWFWKISVHLAASSFVMVLINLLYGWQWWPLFFLLPLVMWSRVVRKRHTVMQTVAGAGLTILLTLGWYAYFGY